MKAWLQQSLGYLTMEGGNVENLSMVSAWRQGQYKLSSVSPSKQNPKLRQYEYVLVTGAEPLNIGKLGVIMAADWQTLFLGKGTAQLQEESPLRQSFPRRTA